MAQTKIRSGQLDALSYTCNGRLTLESGVPISTEDQTSGSIVYFTPYKGNYVGLYDGAKWEVNTFSETELDISGFSGSTVYDIFGYDNSGTFALTSGSWSGSAVRDVELTTQDGIYVRTGEEDKRYLGTIYVNDTGVCQDTVLKRFVWNYYNRMPKKLKVIESTDSWTYTTSTWRQVNAAAANKVETVIGISEVFVSLVACITISNPTEGIYASTSIGIDSTTVPSHDLQQRACPPVANYFGDTNASIKDNTLGYHSYNWLEYSGATGTVTWYGDQGYPDHRQAGMLGEVIG